MARTLDEVLAGLPPARRVAIEAKAAKILEEEMTLRQLREALSTSQEALAQRLGVHQSAVSKLERRTDMYVSSLREHVKAMGGELVLQVKFPDRAPICIKQFRPLKSGKGKA